MPVIVWEACIRGMEGIIRNLRTHYPHADVIVITYFVNPRMLEQLQKGKTPLSMGAHEEVLETYQISRIPWLVNWRLKLKRGNLLGMNLGVHTPSNLEIDFVRICIKDFSNLHGVDPFQPIPEKHALPPSSWTKTVIPGDDF